MDTTNSQLKPSTLEESGAVTKQTSLRQAVTDTVKKYYDQVEPSNTNNVYEMVLAEVEDPLLQETMKFTRGNQSLSAIVLGLSRGTLRKLLKKYGMDNSNTTNIVPIDAATKQESLRQAVTDTVKKYYDQVEPSSTNNVYEMVLAEVEDPLLQETMKFTRGNQSRAAIVLGLSRGTLRKLLKKYNLD